MEETNKLMSESIRISIITVCLNAKEELKQTIESVLAQNYSNLEYIIQDGKSSDGTMKCAASYSELFLKKQINYRVYSEKDKGIYDAMNQAAEKCTGKYILFLNAGDTLCHKNIMNKLNEKYKLKKVDVYYGDALMIDQSGIMLFKADMSLINKRMPFSHQACFILKDLFLKYKYNINYKICADYELISRLYRAQCSFMTLGTLICRYEMNGISSTHFVEKRKEHEKILWTYYKSKSLVAYLVRMSEAYIKSIINYILPQKMLNQLRRVYMDKIKHYIFWNEEMY